MQDALSSEAILVVVVDPTAAATVNQAILRYLTDSRDIESIFAESTFVVLVKTALTARELRIKLVAFTGETKFLVAGVDPSNFDGWLPVTAFKWVAKHRPPPPPPASNKRLN